jgi:hypothetical protein
VSYGAIRCCAVLQVARGINDPAQILVGYRLVGSALQHGGQQRESRHYIEHVVAAFVAHRDQRSTAWFNYDQLVLATCAFCTKRDARPASMRFHCVSHVDDRRRWPEVSEIWPLKAQRGNRCNLSTPLSSCSMTIDAALIRVRQPPTPLFGDCWANPMSAHRGERQFVWGFDAVYGLAPSPEERGGDGAKRALPPAPLGPLLSAA